MKGLPGLGLLTKASISFIEYGEPAQRKHLLSMEALATTAFYSLDRFKSHRRQPAIEEPPAIPMAPSVRNAVLNAAGVAVDSLPLEGGTDIERAEGDV